MKQLDQKVIKIRRNLEMVQSGQKCSSTVNSRDKVTAVTKIPISGESPVSTHSTRTPHHFGCCLTWDTFLWALSYPAFYGSGHASLFHEFFLKLVNPPASIPILCILPTGLDELCVHLSKLPLPPVPQIDLSFGTVYENYRIYCLKCTS